MLVWKDSRNLLEEAGALLCTHLRDAKERPKLFLTSGGSSFALLDHITSEALGPQVTVAVLDERFSEDPKANNFAQLAAHPFYKRAQLKGCRFIETYVRVGEECEAFTARLEGSLRSWRAENPKGFIVATIGIAEDGHTAGIMSMPDNPLRFKELFQGKNWVVGYHVSVAVNPFTERVTTTLSFLLEQVDVAVGCVGDEKKRAVLHRLMKKEAALHELPAMVLHEMKHVVVFSNVLYHGG